jgi:hypothetical protein
MDIPEFAGGTMARSSGPLSPGAARTSKLRVTTTAFKDLLLEWASDIEEEPAGAVTPLQFNAVTKPKFPDPIERLRLAIKRKGNDAKPEVLIEEAGIAKKEGRKALRQLEEFGEYKGFARRKSTRWK